MSHSSGCIYVMFIIHVHVQSCIYTSSLDMYIMRSPATYAIPVGDVSNNNKLSNTLQFKLEMKIHSLGFKPSPLNIYHSTILFRENGPLNIICTCTYMSTATLTPPNSPPTHPDNSRQSYCTVCTSSAHEIELPVQ